LGIEKTSLVFPTSLMTRNTIINIIKQPKANEMYKYLWLDGLVGDGDCVGFGISFQDFVDVGHEAGYLGVPHDFVLVGQYVSHEHRAKR